MKLLQRLKFDEKTHLGRLVDRYLENDALDLDANMFRHFEVARRKPEAFLNHPQSLGISIGGSNTKVMLGEMKDGKLRIDEFLSVKNPEAPTELYAFLDDILKKNRNFWRYLTSGKPVTVGVSLPTLIVNGAPFHRTKVPTILKMTARTERELVPELNFKRNFQVYADASGINLKTLYYNMDAIIAHYGGVSLLDIRPEDRSLLLVCGTGLAAADDNFDRLIGMVRILDTDGELYPPELTEDGQDQYAIAGKGLYGVMKRAVKIKAAESGSRLSGYDLDPFFASPRDTKTVYDIWENYALGEPRSDKAGLLYQYAGEAAYGELGEIATLLSERAYKSLADCITACLVKIDRKHGAGRCHIITEGSIINNRHIHSRVKAQMAGTFKDTGFFAGYGLKAPDIVWGQDKGVEIDIACENREAAASQLDYTIIGAFTSAVAEDILKTGLSQHI